MKSGGPLLEFLELFSPGLCCVLQIT